MTINQTHNLFQTFTESLTSCALNQLHVRTVIQFDAQIRSQNSESIGGGAFSWYKVHTESVFLLAGSPQVGLLQGHDLYHILSSHHLPRISPVYSVQVEMPW